MKYKILLLLTVLTLLLSSCEPKIKTDQEVLYEAQKNIMSIEGYTCTARASVYGNKKPITYVMKHWFKAPNMYKIELVEPEVLKGKTTIYSDGKAYVSHPRIGQGWVMENGKNSTEEKMFLGHFINNFVNTEGSEVTRENLNGTEYILLSTEIPGNNPHFSTEKLWFDTKDYYPYRLQILDSKDKIVIDIQYYNFQINDKMEDDTFKIQ